jgi:hypothetical protein
MKTDVKQVGAILKKWTAQLAAVRQRRMMKK